MTTTERAAVAHAAGWRQRLGLAVVCLGTVVAPLDSSVNIALPAITDAFSVPLDGIRWVVICYVLTYSSLLLIFGKVGDIAGYRRVFQTGLVISTAGFVACSLATVYSALLLGRVLQGVGIALTLSCAPALATTLYDESQRTRVLGVYAAMTAVGAACGPLVGGALLDIFGWSVVFAMRVPLAVAAFVLSWIIPTRPVAPGAARGFDGLGALLLIGWLVPLLLAVALRGELAGSQLRLALLSISVAMLAAFVWHERRHPEPIIRPALFRNIEFTLMNVMSVVANYAAFTILLLVPYFLVRTMGLDTVRGGVVLAAAAAGTVGGAWLAGHLAGSVGIGRLALIGIVASIAGLLLISQWAAATPLAWIVSALLVQGIGIGLFQVAYTDLVTTILPVKDRGVAGSLTMVTRTIGVVAGASGHSAIHGYLETAAQRAGATAGEAFIAGFQGAFLASGLAVAACLLLGLLRPRLWSLRSA